MEEFDFVKFITEKGFETGEVSYQYRVFNKDKGFFEFWNSKPHRFNFYKKTIKCVDVSMPTSQTEAEILFKLLEIK
jgi:hypothetical protein